MTVAKTFSSLGLQLDTVDNGGIAVTTPIDGSLLARVGVDDPASIAAKVARAAAAFERWQRVPAPQRGELVRRFAAELREHKSELGRLVTLEAGKIPSEGEGEVQETIDICDFAVGLSRRSTATRSPRSVRVIGSRSSGTRSARSALSRPSTFLSRCGRGTR